jgi:hypothetical protein
MLEGRLKKKGLFNPSTIDERKARSAKQSSIGEQRRNKMRGKGIEMISGFGLKEGEKLMFCRTLTSSSDYAQQR